MFKSNLRAPPEMVLPDFSDDEATTTTTTKSRRVSFGTNFIKEFIVGSAVSAQCASEYEQAFSSSDSSNINSSHSTVESSTINQHTHLIDDCHLNQKPLPLGTSSMNTSKIETKFSKFSSTICFSADSPSADIEFTGGCINLAKSILEKKNKEMTVIISSKPKALKEVQMKDETKFFEGSQFDMSMTNVFEGKDMRRDNSRVDEGRMKIFNETDCEMSKLFTTRASTVMDLEESNMMSDDSVMESDDSCKENKMPLNMIVQHLDDDASDLEDSLFKPKKSFNDVFKTSPFNASSDSEKMISNSSRECPGTPMSITQGRKAFEESLPRMEVPSALHNEFSGVMVSCGETDEIFKEASSIDMSETLKESQIIEEEMDIECNPIETNGNIKVDEIDKMNDVENYGHYGHNQLEELSNKSVETSRAAMEIESEVGEALEVLEAEDLGTKMEIECNNDEVEPQMNKIIEAMDSETKEKECSQMEMHVPERHEIQELQSQITENQIPYEEAKIEEAQHQITQKEITDEEAEVQEEVQNRQIEKEEGNQQKEVEEPQIQNLEKEVAYEQAEAGEIENQKTEMEVTHEPEEVEKAQNHKIEECIPYQPVEVEKTLSPQTEKEEPNEEFEVNEPQNHQIEKEVVYQQVEVEEAENQKPEKEVTFEQVESVEAVNLQTEREEETYRQVEVEKEQTQQTEKEIINEDAQCQMMDDKIVETVECETFEQNSCQTQTISEKHKVKEFENHQTEVKAQSPEPKVAVLVEPPLIDQKVLKTLETQSAEEGCNWRIQEVKYGEKINKADWKFRFQLLESQVGLNLGLDLYDKDDFDIYGHVESVEVCPVDDVKLRRQEYWPTLEFGLRHLKKLVEEERKILKTVLNVAYFLDTLNSFTSKLNRYLKQVYAILTEYPGSQLVDSILSFRLYSFPLFFSTTLSINMTDLYKLSKSSLAFVTDLGVVDEKKIAAIFENCLESGNSLTEFVIRSTEYLVESERKTGRITKRHHIPLLPHSLR